MYSGTSPGAYGLASASQSGAQSEPGELVGRHRLGEVYRKRLEALEHHRVLHHALHLGVQALQHLARSRPRRVEAEMRTAVDTLDALLFQRRHIRKIRMAHRAGDRHHAQLPGSGCVQPDARIKGELDLPAEEIVERGPRSLVRNVVQLDLRLAVEHLGRDMRRGAVARRAVVELAGIGARIGEELLVVARRYARMQKHVERDAAGRYDRHQQLHRIEIRALHDVRRDHHARAGRVRHGVAIGIGVRDRFEADIAVAARAVLDDERLAERLAEPCAEHARGDVGDAAGCHVDDHAHRLRRPLLRIGVRRYKHRGEQ